MTMKKIFLTLLITLWSSFLFAETPYYLDFNYILNESNAGKKAQTTLKNRLDSGIKSLNGKEKSIQESEKKLIQKKKIISAEEYKKEIQTLRASVAKLQKERSELINSIAKKKKKAKDELLKNLNPIIKDYMIEKKIRMVVNKKALVLADENLDITQDIIKIFNTKLKEIKLN
jgi:Skp family chaperone for outer membrane proteins